MSAHVELLPLPLSTLDAAVADDAFVDVDAAAPLCAAAHPPPPTATALKAASSGYARQGSWWSRRHDAHVREDDGNTAARTCAPVLPPTAVQAARAAALFAVITLEYTTYSFLLPFFPIVVEGKGVPSAVSGALFAGYALALVAAAAVTGLVLLRRWTAKGLIVLFLLLNGAVTCAMTVVPHLDPPAFTAVAIVLRALQGASAGVVETAIVPVLFRMYPAHLGRINGTYGGRGTGTEAPARGLGVWAHAVHGATSHFPSLSYRDPCLHADRPGPAVLWRRAHRRTRLR